MSSDERKIDWLGVWVRFACGAIIGAIAGLRAAAWDGSKGAVLGCIAAGAVVVGTLSAVFGDAFWEAAFGRTWWWW